MNALGMVEVYGFTTAICCADAAAKAAAVRIIALDTTKPANAETAEVPLVMIVKMEGSVSAVTAGVAAAKAHAEERGLYIVSHIISRPGPDIEKLAFLSKVGKDPIGKPSNSTSPKAELKPDPKPELKPELKPEPKPEPKAEPKLKPEALTPKAGATKTPASKPGKSQAASTASKKRGRPKKEASAAGEKPPKEGK